MLCVYMYLRMYTSLFFSSLLFSYHGVVWYCVGSVSPQDLDSAQSFPLSVAVSFVSLADAADQDYAPPPPPVLFKVRRRRVIAVAQ